MSMNYSKMVLLAGIWLFAVLLLASVGCQSTQSLATSPTDDSIRPLDYSAIKSNSGIVQPSSPFHLARWNDVDESGEVAVAHSAPNLPVLFTDSPGGIPSLLSVESCVQTALAGHPEIIAARYRVQAAQNRVPQAKSLEDPMLGNMFFPIPNNALQTAGGRMQNTIGLSQTIPWPEKLKARAAIACQDVHIAQAEVESIQREIAEAVRLAYYEVWFAQRGTEILTDNRELVDDLIQVAEARYKAGGSQQDVLNAEIQRERLNQQLLELASGRAAAEAELAAYLQQPQTLSIQTEADLNLDDLPTQLDALVALAEQCNPELKGIGFQIQRDLQNQRLANLQRYSDFQLGAQYGFMTRSQAISPVADGIDNISFSVGMTLPIYRNKIRGGINEAAAKRASTARLRQAEQLTIEGRLRRLLSEIDALDQQRTLYRERIIPRADRALEIALSEYTVGKTTFVQLTENYTELLIHRLQVVKLESTLASRLAQLERTVGCPLGL
jgi:outer membrane protein, heavy metal efflux system